MRSVRVRELRDQGETRHRIDRVLPAPFWGIRTDDEPDGLTDRCRAILPRLPEGAYFSHQTAARLLELPLPPRHRTDELRVSVNRGHRAVDAASIVGHEIRVAGGDVQDLRGLPVATPRRVFRDLAATLALPDLVMLGDAMIRRRAPLTTLESLASLDAIRGFRGRRVLLRALPLLDEGSESGPESLLRVAVVQAMLPPVVANADVRDEAGRFVARLDLKFVDYPVAIEYDGDGHRTDAAQWRKDVRRLDDVADAGVAVIRATADDLPGFGDVIRRAASRLRRCGWNP